jgi:hypothetical protein
MKDYNMIKVVSRGFLVFFPVFCSGAVAGKIRKMLSIWRTGACCGMHVFGSLNVVDRCRNLVKRHWGIGVHESNLSRSIL